MNGHLKKKIIAGATKHVSIRNTHLEESLLLCHKRRQKNLTIIGATAFHQHMI